MNMEPYRPFFTADYLMGPNALKLLQELIAAAPDALSGYVLDLGCGKGATSLMLARETPAEKVFAADLWIAAADNWRRAQAWGVADKLIPIHADATALPFAEGFFRGVVSVDAYHYFGGEPGFFAQKIQPLLTPGGVALLAMPGLRQEAAQSSALLREWAGDEAHMFHSAPWWQDTILSGTEGLTVRAWESPQFADVWADWFATGHEYALRDKVFLDRGLADELNFVMLEIRQTP